MKQDCINSLNGIKGPSNPKLVYLEVSPILFREAYPPDSIYSFSINVPEEVSTKQNACKNVEHSHFGSDPEQFDFEILPILFSGTF